jgi:hypothetical protein
MALGSIGPTRRPLLLSGNSRAGCHAAWFRAVLAAAAFSSTAAAQATGSAEEVAQTLANPAARVTALTGQLRIQPGAGDGRTNSQLRLQPVIPVGLPNGWALLTRTILPVQLNQHPQDAFGLGDTSFNAYVIPPPSGAWFFGVGPSVSLPTTTQRSLGSRNYAAGPSAIVARQGNPITVGFLGTQLWTVAAPDASPLRTTTSTFQPFAAYNLGQGRVATVNTELTYNWELPAGRQWTVPVSAGLTQVLPFGDNFLQLGGAVTHYAVPQQGGGGGWEFRLNATLVLPR